MYMGSAVCAESRGCVVHDELGDLGCMNNPVLARRTRLTRLGVCLIVPRESA